jgi:hypothetical protein
MECLGSGELLILSSLPGLGTLRFSFIQLLRENGFDITSIGDNRILLLPSRTVLELEATHLGLLKPLCSETAAKATSLDKFDVNTRQAFLHVDTPDFFTPAEISMLTHHVLSSIKVCTAAAPKRVRCSACLQLADCICIYP